MRVLSTVNNISIFPETETGMKLKYPPQTTTQEGTICLRFFSYQLINFSGAHCLLRIGYLNICATWPVNNRLLDLGMLPWWENDDIVTGVMVLTSVVHNVPVKFYEIPDWNLQRWNTVCLSLSTKVRTFNVILNGKNVLRAKIQKHIINDNQIIRMERDLLKTINIFGFELSDLMVKERVKREEDRKFYLSLFGKITDVNVWNNVLPEEEILMWENGNETIKGNVVKWDINEWDTVGLTEEIVEDTQIWSTDHERESMAFCGKSLGFYESIHFCNQMGGRISIADTDQNVNNIFDSLLQCCDECKPWVFTGHTRLSENSFRNQISGETYIWEDLISTMSQTVLTTENNNFEGDKNCVAIVNKNYLHTRTCKNIQKPVCDLKELPQLHLRGACRDQNLDTVYFVAKEIGIRADEIQGYRYTKIVWDNGNNSWSFINILSHQTIATLHEGLYRGYPIGTHKWYFTYGQCHDPGVTWRQMNLQRKHDQGEFCCSNGWMCINSDYRCDKVFDCLDKSDEDNCSLVVFPTDYNIKTLGASKDIAHRSMGELEGHTFTQLKKLGISFKIQNIYAIHEAESRLDVTFEIECKWFDSRLQYKFLKSNSMLFTLSKNQIWHPKFQFSNLRKPMRTGRGDAEISVLKEATSSVNQKNELVMEETYSGNENRIVMTTPYQTETFCAFNNINDYPFDEEICYIETLLLTDDEIFLNLTTTVIDSGPSEVSRYVVKKWNIEQITNEGGRTKLKLRVLLGRRYMMVLLIVYLPTILMNLINQGTNYFRIKGNDHFPEIIMVNITCMIVLSLMYMSVSQDLPLTTGIKMIEIWLLSSLVYPCLVIAINTIIYRRANKTDVSQNTVIPIQPQRLSMDSNVNMTSNNHPESARNVGEYQTQNRFMEYFAFYLIPIYYLIFIVIYFVVGFSKIYSNA